MGKFKKFVKKLNEYSFIGMICSVLGLGLALIRTPPFSAIALGEEVAASTEVNSIILFFALIFIVFGVILIVYGFKRGKR